MCHAVRVVVGGKRVSRKGEKRVESFLWECTDGWDCINIYTGFVEIYLLDPPPCTHYFMFSISSPTAEKGQSYHKGGRNWVDGVERAW